MRRRDVVTAFPRIALRGSFCVLGKKGKTPVSNAAGFCLHIFLDSETRKAMRASNAQWQLALFVVGLLLGRAFAPACTAVEPARDALLTHVVVPLPVRQLAELASAMDEWWTRFPACAAALSSPAGPHLVFFLAFSNASESPPLVAVPDRVRQCFASVRTCPVRLTAALDTHIDGARALFESVLVNHQGCLEAPLHFALVMEPDTRPVRENWLAALQTYLATSVPRSSWLVGAMFNGDAARVPAGPYVFHRMHLGGNALYNLDASSSPNLRSLYFDRAFAFNRVCASQSSSSRARGADVVPYVASRGGSRNAHDTDVFEYLAHPAHWDFVRRHAAHRVRAFFLGGLLRRH